MARQPLHTLQHGLLLFAVILIAGVLRFGYPGVNSFASDEARVSLMALDTIHGEHFASYGIASSAGARNLPASIYVFTIPFLLSSNPLVATYFVGILNILAIAIIYRLGSRVWNRWVALIAALYLATAPYNVFYSRNIWTQDLLVILSSVWLLLAYHVTESTTSRRRFLAITGLTFITGFSFQVHVAAISLIGAWVYLFVRFKWWRSWVAVGLGIGLSIIPLLPFLYTTVCCAPELVEEYVSGTGEGTIRLNLAPIESTFRLAVNDDWNFLALGSLPESADVTSSTEISAMLVAIILLIGTFSFFISFRRDRTSQQRNFSEIMLVFLLSPIVTFALFPLTVQPHYLLTTLPLIALVAGMSFYVLQNHVLRFTLLMLVLVTSVMWIIQVQYSLASIDGRTAPNGMGTTLQSFQAITERIPADRPLIVHTQSTDAYTRGEPAIWKVLRYGDDLRLVNGWTNAILPTKSALFVTDADGMPAFEEVEAYLDDVQRYQPVEGAAPIYTGTINFDGFQQTYQWLETPVMFSSGLTLLGWRMRIISGRFRVSTVYRAESIPEETVLNQFTHLRTSEARDPSTQPPYVSDISFLPENWQTGDILIGMADFFLPDDFDASQTLTIDLGQYHPDSGVRFPRADGNGDYYRN